MAEEKRALFLKWCQKEGWQTAGDTLLRDWERIVTFYQFPKEHWRHLRTTDVMESHFADLRLGTAAAKHFKKVENGTVVIWQMLMLAEQCFRRLNASEKLMQVYLGFGAGESRGVKEISKEEVLAVV